MIKKKGQRIAVIAMAAALLSQSVQPIFALENQSAKPSRAEIIQTVEQTEDVVEENTESKESKYTIDFKVMAISDLHANLMNYDYYTGSTTKDSGLVKAATLIKQEKAKANKSEKLNEDKYGNVSYEINDDETKLNNLSSKGVENNTATEAVVKKYHDATDFYVNEKSYKQKNSLSIFREFFCLLPRFAPFTIMIIIFPF